jgi:hypothetical protein
VHNSRDDAAHNRTCRGGRPWRKALAITSAIAPRNSLPTASCGWAAATTERTWSLARASAARSVMPPRSRHGAVRSSGSGGGALPSRSAGAA